MAYLGFAYSPLILNKQFKPLALSARGFIILNMIKIDLNKKLDYEVYKNFYDFKTAGVDFGARIIKDHPDITIKNYRKYIDEFYADKKDILEKNKKEFINLLNKKQNIFFDAVKNLFKINFDNSLYAGFISIFDCNPRYFKTKNFQIFYKKTNLEKLEVAFHESFHFAFFEYYDKFFKIKTEKLDKNSGKLWELSEIFNVIILNQKGFRDILEREEKLFYPDLKDKLIIVKKIWNENHDNMKNFIIKSLNIL